MLQVSHINERIYSDSFHQSFKHSLINANELHLNETLLSSFTSVLPPKKPSSCNTARFYFMRTRTTNHFLSLKFGVPPSPKIEGREKPRVSFPSITDKQTKNPIDEQTIKKFDTSRVSSGKVHRFPCIASLLTESSGLRAAGSFLRGFRH